jgi:hypothetical protein
MIAKETDQPYYVSVKTNINPALLRLVLCKQLIYYLSYTVCTVHWEASQNKNVLVYVYINTIFVGPAPGPALI